MAASSKNHALAVPFRRQLDSNVAASESVPRSRPSDALLPVQNPARSQHSLHPRMQGARRHMQLQGSADRRASASESRSVEADPTSPANPRLGDGSLRLGHDAGPDKASTLLVKGQRLVVKSDVDISCALSCNVHSGHGSHRFHPLRRLHVCCV